MSKHFRSIAMIASCLSFVLSSYIYTESEGSLVISVNLLIMLVGAYFIVRIMDSILDFKE